MSRKKSSGFRASYRDPSTRMVVTRELPYAILRQSRDYLYGWNWFHTKTDERGFGYATKGKAEDAAVRHYTTGEIS
jgi:hypothetical protein